MSVKIRRDRRLLWITPEICRAVVFDNRGTRSFVQEFKCKCLAERTMSKAIAGALIGFLITAVPTSAQITREQFPATTQIDKSLIGLPLVTSDGETVGYITEVGIVDGQVIAIGEIVRLLGIGYDAVAIPTKMLAHKGDHAELTITAEEVRARLRRPENE